MRFLQINEITLISGGADIPQTDFNAGIAIGGCYFPGTSSGNVGTGRRKGEESTEPVPSTPIPAEIAVGGCYFPGTSSGNVGTGRRKGEESTEPVPTKPIPAE